MTPTSDKSDMPSKPFPPTPPDPIDPIDEGVRALRQQHKLSQEAHRDAFEQQASAAYERHEADRRKRWIDEYRADNYMPLRDPHRNLPREDQYRISLPPDQRIPRLAEVGEWEQVLYCVLVRAGGTCTIDEIKRAFLPYLAEVDGDQQIIETIGEGAATHTLIHASQLSHSLANILCGAFGVKVKHGRVTYPTKDLDRTEY